MTTRENKLILAQLNLWNSLEDIEFRIKTLAEYVRKEKIDILVLQETIENTFLVPKLRDQGLKHFIFAEKKENENGFPHGPAIFSRYPILNSKEIIFSEKEAINCILCEINVPLAEDKFQKVFIFSTHFIWGGENLAKRLSQAERINNSAENLKKKYPDSQIYLCGDLNDTPDSRTLRFLKGLDLDSKNAKSTFWASANFENKKTAAADMNKYARTTSSHVGTSHPELVPKRCIDYILNYGWNFGKPGGFKNTELFGEDPAISDHLGIKTEIIL